MRIHYFVAFAFLSVLLLAGCSGTNAPVIPSTTYKVKGAVTGLSGAGLTLQNNAGEEIAVAADGTFEFPTAVTIGSAFAVTVSNHPLCKSQTCTVTNATGTPTSDVTNVTVTCADDTKVALITSNWGAHALRVTDDVHSLANSATAVPRITVGSNTTLSSLTTRDNLSVDRKRKIIYVVDSNKVKVFNNADTASGNLAPNRTITVSGATSLEGVSVDSVHDRLYVAGSDGAGKTFIFNSASTIDGTVTPDALLTVTSSTAFVDEKNDRLYVGSGGATIAVFDAAHSLTTASAASRTITFTAFNGGAYVSSLWADACHDRLYVTARNNSTAGASVFAFATASTLNASLNLDSDSAAHLVFSQPMNAMVDSTDRLHVWSDSATGEKIYNSASTLSGTISTTADKSLLSTVISGYGMAYLSY